ncbi:DUF4168 domain-containing protein [Chelativorans sp. AA-79]|uniref:DUF4168 domain-containing protein n=1 Tax=Chelativorans sp. AA-79 TaxID=3028735 RepID=UPI0023F9303C|nr:DUF4168 domain-containing protein [Chelativorans sp. AA-79]WEX07053.1 DUF4168 domain-containing protein [Chelativorans sp. AA-79]
MKNSSRNLLAAACLSAGVVVAAPALAQEPPQPSAPAANQPSEPAAEAPAVSEEKLQSFVVAFAEVEKIKQEYSQRLQGAGSEGEQQQIQNEAGQKMLQAVQDKGISVDEYNQIIRAAQTDPALAERVTEAMGQAEQ